MHPRSRAGTLSRPFDGSRLTPSGALPRPGPLPYRVGARVVTRCAAVELHLPISIRLLGADFALPSAANLHGRRAVRGCIGTLPRPTRPTSTTPRCAAL